VLRRVKIAVEKTYHIVSSHQQKIRKLTKINNREYNEEGGKGGEDTMVLDGIFTLEHFHLRPVFSRLRQSLF